MFRQNDNSQSSLPPALPELGSLPVVNVSDLAEISIDPEQIGPLQINPQSGEEGLRMVLNCRTKQGATAVSAGKVTIVALDPNQEGEAARIARWDVSESQLKQLITEAPQPDGVLFELAWPKNKPTSDALDVFVRLEDNLGNKLQTRQQVQMNTPKYTLWQPPTGEALPDSEIASDDNLPDPQSPLTFKEEENPLQQGEIYKSEIVVAAPQIDALRNRSRQQINPVMVDNQRVAPVNWEQSSRTDENNANRSSSGAVVGLPENHTENSNSPAASTAGRPTWSPYR